MSSETSAGGRIPRRARALMTIVVLVAAAAVIWNQLPDPAFSTDLERIGQGQPAVVVVRDVSVPAGGDVMGLVNQVRPDYAERIEFLAALHGRTRGLEFARAYSVGDGAVLLFDAQGNHIDTLDFPESEAEIRQLLDRAGPARE